MPVDEVGQTPARRKGCGLSFAVVGIAFLVVLLIVGLGALAFHYGMLDRTSVERQAAEEHYAKGIDYLEHNDLELAVAEFERALKLDPKHEKASEKLAEAQQHLEAQPTATPALQEEMKAAYLTKMTEAYQQGNWQMVLDNADQLLALDPAYHRDAVDEMLTEVFYHQGLELVDKDRMKEAVDLFDRALDLQPGHTGAIEAKQLAALYVTGLGFWGTDWPKALESLSALYVLAPDYKDVRQRTHKAYGYYGDDLAGREDWCHAVEAYSQAVAITGDAGIAAKRDQAEARCNPTAEPAATKTPTPDASAPSGPSGTFVGRLVERTGIDSGKMFVRGKVLDANGKGIQSVKVRIHAWDWSAIAITDGNGQYAFDGLSNPVTYTLDLLDLPFVPFDIEGVWGKIAWVDFRKAK
jgi:tetratricopeptide (TPR) repeat protein